MDKMISKVVKSLVNSALKSNANSTTSLMTYQPKAPKSLKNFSKIDK